MNKKKRYEDKEEIAKKPVRVVCDECGKSFNLNFKPLEDRRRWSRTRCKYCGKLIRGSLRDVI